MTTWTAPRGWFVKSLEQESEERMGSEARDWAQRRRKEYAHKFDVPIEQVVVEERAYDTVICVPGRTDIPEWTFGDKP